MPTYIDVISEGLYQWDLSHNPGNVQPMQFYQDLAWGDWLVQMPLKLTFRIRRIGTGLVM
ncbi:hypothetical protein [Anditalea andensis]|uniref:Uncharacterized protein n=1 Tax=Anditalea andensis TaxID=1048983 RepID=A0A074LMW2_9BACT|nr:hypothetical protein [Anditalea andensis]KEO75227.1 hypothetical protein EL17_06080 [Anditalea andensis]